MKINIKTSIYILYNRIISLFFNLELKQNLTRILDIMQDLFLSVNQRNGSKVMPVAKSQKEDQSIRKDHEDWNHSNILCWSFHYFWVDKSRY